ncbi:MAG: acyl-CoA dehydrogenase family protein [Candidatus Hydrogenedentales bacterium]
MPSFELTEEQQQIQDMTRKFAAGEMRPLARDADEAAQLPDGLLDQAWTLGLVAQAIPEAHGGYGLERSAVTGAIVAEELAWGDLSLALAALAPMLMTVPLLEFATEAQQAEWLPKFTGDSPYAATAALTEPRIHFDPFRPETTVTRRNGSAILNGVKCAVPLAGDAEHILVYARRDDTDTVDAVIIDRAGEGVTLEQEAYMGLRPLPLYRVTLRSAEVSRERVLGGDTGIDYMRLLNLSRAAWAALSVGVARASYEYALKYAKEREAFGEPIACRQSIAFMLAEMAMEIDAMRLMAWRTAWRLDRKEDATRDATLARNYCAQNVMAITDYGVQILGGHGYIREHPVELWFRNGRGFANLEGLALV